jgi:two-component system CheB/CheR fusion protein
MQPNDDLHITASKLKFPVVGIGASAGGLEALHRFFEHLPADSGMAFVVILHLSPNDPSHAAEILQRATAMPVTQVTGPTPIQQNHVYVVPPSKKMQMDDGALNIANLEHKAGPQVAIDLFFRTLAEAHKQRAFGIVLSGAGTDGAIGLKRIKEEGGVTLVQSDAEYDCMPRSAMEAGVVDFILPVTELPNKLISIWTNARNLQLPSTNILNLESDKEINDAQAAESALQEVLALLRKHTGHDFRHYKRATVLRRLERRMQVRGVSDLVAYRDCLKENAKESAALLQDLLIGVTNFFRDHETFEVLEANIIPRLFEHKQNNERVRAWVTASSTGEEAYSIAMLLAEYANRHPMAADFQVFATDIDEQAIAFGRAGLYLQSIEADVSQTRLRQFFNKEDRHYRIKKALRDKLLFAPHDILKDSPFSKLDLITCRNLLIYLTRDVQIRVLELFHFALNPGGYLFLGSSETADAADHLFTPVDKKTRIYQAKMLPHTVRNLPSLPMNPTIRSITPAPSQPPIKPKFSFSQIHQRALAKFAPPSVVVDAESNIVHISDDADKFLRYIGGEPSRSLPSLVLPQLRLELRTTVFQAIQSNRSAQSPRVRLERDGQTYQVCMTAHPFHDSDADANFVLVEFNEIEEAVSAETPVTNGASATVLMQLEEELRRTKEQLQETIERAEVSTEELKASNEELQAINEELRSATEELETSKEELQSMNEELVTVNQELKSKVDEASKINDDLNNLIASTDIATVFVDSGMRIKRYTPAATRIFNIIAADIGRSLLDITHRLEYDALEEDAAATFASLRPIEHEVRSNDGRIYIMRIIPYRTTDDHIGGAVMTFIDMTDRRKAEESVKEGERRIQLFAESTKDYAIITSDTNGVITSWNQGATRIFGYAEEEAIGKSLDLLYVPEDIEYGVPNIERLRARTEGRAEDERWHLRKDGSRIFCSGMLTPLEGNEFFGYAKILRDVTERMQAERYREAEMVEEKTRRQNAQTENELKTQFLAVMSHELKQPLNLIQLNTEMLMRVPEIRNSKIGSKAASSIQKTVLNQAQIIDDLLDLSRLSTGKLKLNFADIDVTAIVHAICETAQAEALRRDLSLTAAGIDTPIMIHADAGRVEQVIWNLVNNAIKFTPAGGAIKVEVSQQDDAVRIDVSDTGKGISPDFLPYVFDIYRQQAASPTTRTTGGLGIGLSLVKQLTELHGGHVEAASDGDDKGARFSIWLPLLRLAPDNGNSHSLPASSRIAGLHLLVVDDLEEAASAFKSILEFEGATVHIATNVAEALAVLEKENIDLVLSDIAMPVVDGYEFIRTVRAATKRPNIPAIAVSGLGGQIDIARAMEAGFSGHITKPVTLNAVAEKAFELGITPRHVPERLAPASAAQEAN